MNTAFEIVRKTRSFLLNVLHDLSIEQLNKIPSGFNNNIIWNVGHMIAAQQGICYKRINLELRVTESFFDMYKPGSKPERFITAAEWEEIKSLLFSTIDQLEVDYQTDLFAVYPEWTTRYSVAIGSIDEALQFLPFHEGLHSGFATALKNVVTQ